MLDFPISVSEQKTREERLEMDVNVAYGTHKDITALRTSK